MITTGAPLHPSPFSIRGTRLFVNVSKRICNLKCHVSPDLMTSLVFERRAQAASTAGRAASRRVRPADLPADRKMRMRSSLP